MRKILSLLIVLGSLLFGSITESDLIQVTEHGIMLITTTDEDIYAVDAILDQVIADGGQIYIIDQGVYEIDDESVYYFVIDTNNETGEESYYLLVDPIEDNETNE